MKQTILVMTLVTLAMGCGETRSSSYPDRGAAVADGAVLRGWLPEWLPSTASEIEEWHDLDTNRTIASFLYRQGDPPKLPAECRTVEPLGARTWADRFADGSRPEAVEVFDCLEEETGGSRLKLRVGIDPMKRRVFLERMAA
jgi:hypothetical protein